MIGRIAATIVLLWIAGFVLFATSLPGPASDDRRTDGIVVLTGGAGRLERGAILLRAGIARRLLISGTDRRVRLIDISRAYQLPVAVADRIDLGHSAVDTRSNATETAKWIALHHYRSIRLITTDWHMARARFELARVIKRVTVVPDAVRSTPALPQLVTEYDKYLLRRGASLIERPQAP